jgi:hypothetical protein
MSGFGEVRSIIVVKYSTQFVKSLREEKIASIALLPLEVGQLSRNIFWSEEPVIVDRVEDPMLGMQ